MNDFEVNQVELMKQLKEEYLKSEGYVRLEIIIKQKEDVPYVNVEYNGCSSQDLMSLLSVMDTTKKSIIKRNPETSLYKLFCSSESMGDIELKGGK